MKVYIPFSVDGCIDCGVGDALGVFKTLEEARGVAISEAERKIRENPYSGDHLMTLDEQKEIFFLNKPHCKDDIISVLVARKDGGYAFAVPIQETEMV